MKLYDYPGSGNCHKVRMLLGFLGLPYTRVPVDVARGETGAPAFLAVNPRGQVPVLVEGDITLWDSQAILVYLARTRDDGAWLPHAAVPMAEVMQWLALAGNEILYGLARARQVLRMGRSWSLEECQAQGREALVVLEQRLAGREWLVGGRPTLAEVACYPYVALAPEAGIDPAPYAAVCRWMDRVQAQPGYVGMPGMYAAPRPSR